LRLVSRLARLTIQADAQGASGTQHLHLSEAIQAALQRDWAAVLWSLLCALRNGPEPDWWFDLVMSVRRQQLGPEAGDLQPLLVVRRTLLTLQSMVEKLERGGNTDPVSLQRLQALVRHLREDVIPNWVAIDPNPPHANLTYQEIDEILAMVVASIKTLRLRLKSPAGLKNVDNPKPKIQNPKL
jgi:hypothetical protein